MAILWMNDHFATPETDHVKTSAAQKPQISLQVGYGWRVWCVEKPDRRLRKTNLSDAPRDVERRTGRGRS